MDAESIRCDTAVSQMTRPEELCISHGRDLRSEDVRQGLGRGGVTAPAAFGGSLTIEDGYLGVLVPEHELPFTRIRLTPDEEEEEDMESIRRGKAWVVDIQNPKIITTMLKWIKQNGLEDEALGHLKRIRKHPSADPPCSTLLLSLNNGAPPTLPTELELPDPYSIDVPLYVALTPESLKLKASLWPTVFAPRRKGEVESWTRGKMRWAQDSMRVALKEAKRVKGEGEVPVVSYVPSPYEYPGQLPKQFIAHDTRTSANHPLRHSILNVVRNIADHRSAVPTVEDESPEKQNGNHYLLTDLTLFTTHEPCIMCSMALLHSRVKEVFYLLPMENTGGCGGGVTCVPRLDGVNHRFGVGRWKGGDWEGWGVEDVKIDASLDA